MSDKPYSVYEVDGPPRRRWTRILMWTIVGIVVLALAVSGGSYLWFRAQVGKANARVSKTAVSALRTHPATTLATSGTTLAPLPDAPDSMNILVLGSDNRGNETNGRSDTMMVVHVDRAQNFVSILSIPRDLYVDVQGHGMQKINAAYAYGGAALAITTVQDLTGIDLNQYLEVDFSAFEDITNALGGVYVDVDHRYYNADPTWELIKLSPGYQLLGGHDALEYVRYRHDGNLDFGRMARQQRFLQDLRQQAMSYNNLMFRLPGLVSALFRNVTTTLSANDVLRLAYWGVKLDPGRIKQVVMTGSPPTIAGQAVVVIPKQQLRDYVAAALTAPSQSAPKATVPGDVTSSATSALASAAASTSVATTVETMPNSSEWKALAGMVPYQLEGPGYVPPGFKYSDRMPQKGGTYDIVPGDAGKPALRMIYRYEPQGVKSELYLGITETTWLSAPIASKGTQVTKDGVTFTLVGTSQDVDHIWWTQNNVLYFISNTLTYTASKAELLKMAESMMVIPRP